MSCDLSKEFEKLGKLNEIQWGGSGIERVVFDYIQSKVPNGSTVIELGSGYVSTTALSLFYNLYSVEHNVEFIGKVEGTKYIYAADVNGWYDVNALKANLPSKKDQKLILIDGLSRNGILKNLNLFNRDALFIIHDTYRDAEKQLAVDLGKKLKRTPQFFTEGDYWAVI